jgi:hypothetical protein
LQQEEDQRMELQFIRGDPAAPRGHAIVLVRPSERQARGLATYLIVLPVKFTLGRFVPPFLASQLGMEGLMGQAGAMDVMPVPPVMEEIDDIDALIALGEQRDDDVIELKGLYAGQETQVMELTSMAGNEYHQLYQRAATNRPVTRSTPSAIAPRETPASALPEDETLASLLSAPTAETDRERVGEVATLVSRLRYAQESGDMQAEEDAKRALRRSLAPLSEKYWPDQIFTAATEPHDRGIRLTELLLTRAFKLVAEEYSAIPELEDEIRRLGDLPAQE